MAAPPLAPPEAAPLDLLARGLDRLQAEDPRELPAGALGQQLSELFTCRNRLDAEITRRVAVLDRSGAHAAAGAHTAAAWLRREVRLSPNAASEQVRVARQLERLPEAGRAFAAGELAFPHLAAISRVTEDAPARVVQEAEPCLTEAARQTDPYHLARLTRHLRHTFDPDACLAEAERNHDRRRLHLSESMGGLFFIDGVLDTECGAGLRTALEAIMGPPAAGDGRTPAQRRHDALQDLVRRQLDAGELPRVGGQKPHLTLTADLATLARLPGSRAADLDWGQPVPGETLRRLACDCAVTPVLVSERGEPLRVGRTRRTFTGVQRRALVLRDRGCVLCGRPPAWTDGHHLRHWVDGGETVVSNGALLCRRCHTRVHEGGLQLVRRPDGTWAAVRTERPP